jgi:hypothetical protein
MGDLLGSLVWEPKADNIVSLGVGRYNGWHCFDDIFILHPFTDTIIQSKAEFLYTG